ncbi:MAG TPA: hypothetical protein VGF86_12440 [Candidatus Tumulicola sp.]|jgi:hypothetical protein
MRVQLLLAAGLATLVSACNAAGTSQSVPPANVGPAGAGLVDAQPAVDTTSVLKTLTNQEVIGSTVDPTNGDQNPHGLTYVNVKPYGGGPIAKGDIAVCNYNDSANVQGNGTTIEYMPGKPGSSPKTLVQNASLKGCASLISNAGDGFIASFYAMDSGAKNVGVVSIKGKFNKSITNKAIVEPWNSTYMPTLGYPPGDGILLSDPSSGKLVRIDLGTMKPKAPVYSVISGFPTNKGKPGSILGPSGVMYTTRNEQLYVVDGANNTVYSFIHAYDDLNQANSIVIGADGKSFSGPRAKDAKVLYSGGQLKSPITASLLPNGNMVIGNTANNLLVEIASNGKVLATKKVDKGKAGAIFGIVAIGSSDSNTQIYFNDDNANNVQLLTK